MATLYHTCAALHCPLRFHALPRRVYLTRSLMFFVGLRVADLFVIVSVSSSFFHTNQQITLIRVLQKGLLLMIGLYKTVMQSHAFRATTNRDPNHTVFISRSFSLSNLAKSRASLDRHNINRCFHYDLKLLESRVRRLGFRVHRGVFRVCASDDDSIGFSFDDGSVGGRPSEYIYSSSGEDSDGDIILQPITDVDLPTSKDRLLPADDSIAVASYRIGMLGRARKRRKIFYGILNNIGLVSFSIVLLLLVDQCGWRIVRLPLAPFHLTRPFLISMALVASVGYVCVPLFHILKLRSVVRKVAPTWHSYKRGTPTMGGLYFVPIGVLVAEVLLKFTSVEVSGVAAATISLAAIGLLDDILGVTNNNRGLPSWLRVLLEVAVGMWFSYWLHTTDISTPYNMKMVVPLPGPLGLVCLGKVYPLLTSFCFVSMGNGINLTDGLDGLAAGTAALAFIGMSIVVLPVCSDLSIFGASMAGACAGFLFQNRYKASIFMGDTGSLALGGALAAMASCSGMFFPLFISSGIYILDALSVIVQVLLFKATKRVRRRVPRLFRVAPFHYHLELRGVKEPTIVGAAYVATSVLVLFAAYIGLTSV